MKRYVLVILIVVLSLIGSSGGATTVRAQESAATLLPTPEQLGAGWTVIDQENSRPVPDALRDVFTDTAHVILGGPNGARITIFTYLTSGSNSALRQSWNATNGQFETYRDAFDYDYDQDRESDLAAQSPPRGCADARRTYGVEETSPRFAIGVTLCAADPNLIILVFTSGEINGLSGQPAADSIVELVLSVDEEPAP